MRTASSRIGSAMSTFHLSENKMICAAAFLSDSLRTRVFRVPYHWFRLITHYFSDALLLLQLITVGV